MIPLTDSLYVQGKLKNTDSVLVEIGTGYYVQKVRNPNVQPSKAAIEFTDRKIKIVKENIQKVEQSIIGKGRALEMIVMVMQQRRQQQQQQQRSVKPQ